MNTYLELLKDAKPTYKKIRTTASLRWLNQSYNVGGKLPVKEYYSTRNLVFWANVLKYSLVSITCLASGDIICATAILIPKSHYTVMILSVIAEITIMIVLDCLYIDRWEVFLNAYVGQEWQTREFIEDIRNLLLALDSDDLIRDIGMLGGNGKEIGCVPKHMIEACEDRLTHFALCIKKDKVSPEVEANLKRIMNSNLELFTERFRILSRDYEISRAYDAADQLIREEQKRRSASDVQTLV